MLVSTDKCSITLNTVIRHKAKSKIWFLDIAYCIILCFTVTAIMLAVSLIFNALFVNNAMVWNYYASVFYATTKRVTLQYSYLGIFLLTAVNNFVYLLAVEIIALLIYTTTKYDWLAIILTIFIGNVGAIFGNTVRLLNITTLSYNSLLNHSYVLIGICECVIIAVVIILGNFLFKRKEFLNKK